MALPRSATDEILTRIKSLDHEEGWKRRQAENMRTRAATMDAEAEGIAATRRQYEFLLKQLNGDPVPAKLEAAL